MRKSDVEFHSDNGWGPGRPAVNVKVYRDWRDGLRAFARDESADPRFDEDWIQDHESELEWTFEAACMDGWEQLETDAEEVFGAGV
jgi:hypothetical protein